MSNEIEIPSQELRRILLSALECLKSGKINKATADRITDRANFVVNAMRSTQDNETADTGRRLKVSMAVGELREAEDTLARLLKPPDIETGRQSPPKKRGR
jgi:hypothetical protein